MVRLHFQGSVFPRNMHRPWATHSAVNKYCSFPGSPVSPRTSEWHSYIAMIWHAPAISFFSISVTKRTLKAGESPPTVKRNIFHHLTNPSVWFDVFVGFCVFGQFRSAAIPDDRDIAHNRLKYVDTLLHVNRGWNQARLETARWMRQRSGNIKGWRVRHCRNKPLSMIID